MPKEKCIFIKKDGKRCGAYPSIQPGMDPKYCYNHQPSKLIVKKPSPPKPPIEPPKKQSPSKLPVPVLPKKKSPSKLPVPVLPKKQSPPKLPVPVLPKKQSPPKLPVPVLPKKQSPHEIPIEPMHKLIIVPKNLRPAKMKIVPKMPNLKLNKIPIDTHVYTMDKFTMEPPKKSPQGTYGEVLFGTIIATGDRIVLKKYKEPITDIDSFQSKIKELIFLRHLNQYPETKVVKFYGICIQGDILYLVLQRLDKDLSNISIDYSEDDSKNRGRLPPNMYKVIFYKILQAFNAIHSLGVIHNDIKLANIMLFGNDIRIIDFGISEFLGLGPTKELVRGYICTQYTKAPDTYSMPHYLPTNRKTYASDLFSIGASMIHLIIRSYRYLNVDPIKKIIMGKADEYDPPNPTDDITGYLKSKIGDDGIDLLVKIMQPDVHQRWCCKQALNHPYFANIATLLPVGIDRGIVGGGNTITDKRLRDDVIIYTPQEFANKSMELCYLEELYQNYRDNIIPVLNITQKDTYNQITLWILNEWNKKGGVLIFNSFDSVVNSQLLMKNIIDDVIKRRGVDNFTVMTMLIHNLYDTILSYYTPEYKDYKLAYNQFTKKSIKKNELHQLMTNEFLVHNEARYELLPVWCVVMYIFLKLKHEIIDPRINGLGDKLLSFIGKWVLFFFIQDTPYDAPINVGNLVKFCAIFVISRHLNIPIKGLNDSPIVNWLSIPPEICDKLVVYYNDRIANIETLGKTCGMQHTTVLETMFLAD